MHDPKAPKAQRARKKPAKKSDRLLEVIDQELNVQILAIGRLGKVRATAKQVRLVAEMVADAVEWNFQVEAREENSPGRRTTS
jgi:hypothetical protein